MEILHVVWRWFKYFKYDIWKLRNSAILNATQLLDMYSISGHVETRNSIFLKWTKLDYHLILLSLLLLIFLTLVKAVEVELGVQK